MFPHTLLPGQHTPPFRHMKPKAGSQHLPPQSLLLAQQNVLLMQVSMSLQQSMPHLSATGQHAEYWQLPAQQCWFGCPQFCPSGLGTSTALPPEQAGIMQSFPF